MTYPFKICDSIHGFIRFGEEELRVIDSAPFQRLRYIMQMGTAYLVYPGATHTRFEHSLGVMELAGRIYQTLTAPHTQMIHLGKTAEEIAYWLLILRLAALCHDLGHLPFSHTAEKTLLPDGGHEKMTRALICSPELEAIWQTIGPHAETDIIKLALSNPECSLTPWEKVLSQIITEDNFGADRIDYLIRDGRCTGVGYSHFDYHQLIDSLRILPDGDNLALGITFSGMQSVESLWTARYMMYARVYHHPKARVFTNHMHRFMGRHYHNQISTDPQQYIKHTDYTLLAALSQAADEGDYDAKCLLKRDRAFCELILSPDQEYLQKLKHHFGDDIFIDLTPVKSPKRYFPVVAEDGSVVSSLQNSTFLREIPDGSKPFSVYIHPKRLPELKCYIND